MYALEITSDEGFVTLVGPFDDRQCALDYIELHKAHNDGLEVLAMELQAPVTIT